MPIIRTVNGDITPDTLGICYPHDHLIGRPPEPFATNEPDLVLNSEDAAVQSLRELKAAGGNALVEMTPIDYHRDPAALQRVAAAAGVHVIAITGYLKEKFSRPHIASQTVAAMAARFTREIEHGMDNTDIRAGVIKASSSRDEITDCERKVFLAAASAQRETGVLISTHTEGGTMAPQQVALLTGAGVPPDRILIGHMDRKLDIDYHLRVAETGVYLGFDQIGKSKYASDTERIAMLTRLIDAGYTDQIMLSMDIARRSYLPAYGGTPGFAYLLYTFVPMMRAAGVDQTLIDRLIVKNPARALAGKPQIRRY